MTWVCGLDSSLEACQSFQCTETVITQFASRENNSRRRESSQSQGMFRIVDDQFRVTWDSSLESFTCGLDSSLEACQSFQCTETVITQFASRANNSRRRESSQSQGMFRIVDDQFRVTWDSSLESCTCGLDSSLEACQNFQCTETVITQFASRANNFKAKRVFLITAFSELSTIKLA